MSELRRLRYFLAVAEERNFTRAAERLHIAQPALSRQVRELERELGVELLERTTHKVEPTEAGRMLLERGPALLAAADSLWRGVREYADGRIGIDEPYVHESVIGTTFTGRVLAEKHVGPFAAVETEIAGRGFLTGLHQFVVDPDDPTAQGFLVR